jgi:membrane protease YdiL (CAAX protease family)
MEETSTTLQLVHDYLGYLLFFGGLVTALALSMREQRLRPDYPGLTQTLTGRALPTLQVGITVSTLLLLYALASGVGIFFYEEQIPLVRLVVTLLIYSIIILLAAAIFRRRGRSFSQSMGMRNLNALALSPVFYIAVIPFIMLAAKGYHLLLEFVQGSEPELQDIAHIVSGDLSWLAIAYMVTAIFAAPVYEEVLFRGILFPFAVKKLGLAGGCIVVSLLFAALHYHTPAFVPLFLLSLVLCLFYWRTESLWASIGIHVIFNAVNILALNLVG